MAWFEQFSYIQKESPLGWWLTFVEGTYPWVFQNNPVQVLWVGCSILAQATKLFINFPRPMACNFYIALVGSPAAGKGRLIDCVNAVINNVSEIAEIPTGSAEAIEEAIQHFRFGYLIWDEMGELTSSGKGDYLHRVKYLLNKAYYLDRITRARRKDKPTYIAANTYFLSVILAGLPQDWKGLEKKWGGGIERRFLVCRLKGRKEPFKMPKPSTEAAEALSNLVSMLNAFEGIGVVLPPFELSGCSNLLRGIEDRYISLIEEYTYKIVAVLLLNNVLANMTEDDILVSGQSGHTGHIIRDINLLTINDLYLPNMTNMTYDQNNNPESSSRLGRDVVMTLISSLCGFRELADDKLYAILDRMESYINNTGKLVVTRKEFAREILKTAVAREYNYILKALSEAEYVRLVKQGRATYVVLDPNAKICYNCKHYNGVCRLQYPTPEERKILSSQFDPVKEGMSCEDFEKLEE